MLRLAEEFGEGDECLGPFNGEGGFFSLLLVGQ